MPKIELGRYSDLLRRLLGMSGELRIQDELAPELQACLILESDRPEWAFLTGAKLFSASSTQAAAVAAVSAFRIRNPTGSAVLSVVEAMWVTLGTAGLFTVTHGVASADLATALSNRPRDSRWGAAVPSATRFSRDNAAAGVTGQIAAAGVLANSSFAYTSPIVIAPGFAVEIVTVSINTDLTVTVSLRERELKRYEQA